MKKQDLQTGESWWQNYNSATNQIQEQNEKWNQDKNRERWL